jgi:hypothetical protein
MLDVILIAIATVLARTPEPDPFATSHPRELTQGWDPVGKPRLPSRLCAAL